MRTFLLAMICFAVVVPSFVNADDLVKSIHSKVAAVGHADTSNGLADSARASAGNSAARASRDSDTDEEAIDDADDDAPASLDAEDDAEGDAEEQD